MLSAGRREDNNAGEGMGLLPVCHATPRFFRNSICVRREKREPVDTRFCQ
jgi:hypothetical protein